MSAFFSYFLASCVACESLVAPDCSISLEGRNGKRVFIVGIWAAPI